MNEPRRNYSTFAADLLSLLFTVLAGLGATWFVVVLIADVLMAVLP